MKDFYCEEVFSGLVKVKKVFETKHVLAFHHTHPYWPVHIVVVPKKHIDSLLSLSSENHLWEMIAIIKRVSTRIVKKHGACRVVTNIGSYQDSKHLHWHLSFGNPKNSSIV